MHEFNGDDLLDTTMKIPMSRGVAVSLVLLLAGAATAGEQPKKTPRQTLLAIVQKARKRHGLPALAAAVIQDGKLLAVAADGVRVITKKVRVTDDDLFHIGSCTKAMTATLIGRLVEKGVFKWESTLPDLLPSLSKSMHPGYRQVRLAHLLAHQSGLVANVPQGTTLLKLHALKGSPQSQRLAYARLMLAMPPLHKPGTKFLYSNAGYSLVGCIAEQTLKKSWEELMEEHVFKPLGMKRVGHGAMGTPGKLDQPLQHRSLLGFPVPIDPGPRSDNPLVLGPAGRVHLPMKEWAKFVAVHLAGARGESNLLKAATYKRLHQPVFGKAPPYACGWMAVTRKWAGGPALNHSGSNTMNFSTVWIAPKKNFAILAATNHGGGFRACDDIAVGCVRDFLNPPTDKSKSQKSKKSNQK